MLHSWQVTGEVPQFVALQQFTVDKIKKFTHAMRDTISGFRRLLLLSPPDTNTNLLIT